LVLIALAPTTFVAAALHCVAAGRSAD